MPRRPRAEGFGAKGLVPRWLRTHRRVARSTATRLLAQPGSSLLTVLAIAVSLLLPSLLFSLNATLDQLLAEFQQGTRITLFLEETLSDLEASEVSDDLLSLGAIKSVSYISKAEGLAEFSAASGLGDVLAALPNNPLPAVILVTPVSGDPAAISALAAELGEHEDIAVAQLDSLWLERLAAVSRLITAIGTGLSVIVVLGLFVIIGNTIKLAIENRRQEIRVIELVGGTDAFIARPFLYSGLFYGGAGGVVAVLMQLIVFYLFSPSVENLLNLYQTDLEYGGFDAAVGLWIVLAGAVIGWAAALLASLRHIWSLDP